MEKSIVWKHRAAGHLILVGDFSGHIFGLGKKRCLIFELHACILTSHTSFLLIVSLESTSIDNFFFKL